MGNKIRLDLDALDVQSFETETQSSLRGTVRGNLCSDSTCNQDICACTDGFGGCYATNVNCSNTSGPGESNDCTQLGTRPVTCATGIQDICHCG